ncbi:beta-1,3-galactosyltransferase 1 isoform X2 [Dendroctonus ponderosae]|nr:beta-1,3-galactosyltransferase 1 isoform X2 [Dendroctonus ponderosae]
MPKDFCDKPSFLVIVCISSPSGFEARRVIRKTWGRDRSVMGHNISLYFLLGQTTDIDIQKNITEEYLLNNDIVQESFYDTYNNLTLKSAMMLKLFTLKCQSKAKYLLKIDDDIYLNLPKLIDDLMTRNQTDNLLMGSAICGSRPIRSSGDKWYAGPSYLFPYDIYPSYISGTSYCMSGDVAEKILNTALNTPIFHLEDVYLTGICAKKIGLNITHNGRFTFHYLKQNFCLYKQLITVHYQEPELIQQVFDSIRDADVEEKCRKEDQIFLVHRWLIENVFMANKTRKIRCS